MKPLKYIFLLAFVFLLAGLQVQASGFTFDLNDCPDQTSANEVIIVEIGFGITRCGFHTQAEPIEFGCTVREAENYYKNDFRNMMNQVYSKLNVTDKSAHPVLIVEPDDYNGWRRVDMANVLMGENQSPWMYVMWNSVMITYGNNASETGSALVYHADNNHSYVGCVVSGWPYSLGYAKEFLYHEPTHVRRADSAFWSMYLTPWEDRPDVVGNVILSGNNWDGISEADVKAFEDRLDLQRFSNDHISKVNRPTHQRRHEIFNSAKKMCNDGIMLDWDLAFQQSRYQSKGANDIRTWIF